MNEQKKSILKQIGLLKYFINLQLRFMLELFFNFTGHDVTDDTLMNITGIAQDQNVAEDMPLTITQMSPLDAIGTFRNLAVDNNTIQYNTNTIQ